MRYALALLFVCLPVLAQAPAGKWLSNTRWFDQDRYQRMELALDGDRLTGKMGRDTISGTFRSGAIEITVKQGDNASIELDGRLEGDRITGTGKATQGKF